MNLLIKQLKFNLQYIDVIYHTRTYVIIWCKYYLQFWERNQVFMFNRSDIRLLTTIYAFFWYFLNHFDCCLMSFYNENKIMSRWYYSQKAAFKLVRLAYSTWNRNGALRLDKTFSAKTKEISTTVEKDLRKICRKVINKHC